MTNTTSEYVTARLQHQGSSWTTGFLPITGRILLTHLTRVSTLVFTIGIPVMMYLIFGTNQDYSQIPVPHGNTSGVVLLNLTQYGAAMAAASMGAEIAIDHVRGLPRMWALTPLGVKAWMFSRVVVAVALAAIVTVIIFTIGAALEAQMEPSAWVQSFALVTVSTVVPALLGLTLGAVIGSEDAYGILGGGMSVLGFLSGMFLPLNQMAPIMQRIAEVTPLWCINQIALSPLLGWQDLSWKPVVWLAAWLVLLVAGAVWAAKRMTRR